MAEIHVEPRKRTASAGTTWIWILVAILIIGAVVYYFMSREENTGVVPDNTAPASSIYFETEALLHKTV